MTFALLLITYIATAQSNTEYNIKGDEAMKNLDYSSAKIHYEDGVVQNCDLYSINKLTSIWFDADKDMRATLRTVMARSLKCVDERASSYNDTTSMKMLITFYEHGIGTEVNEMKVEMWQAKLDEIRNPYSRQGEEEYVLREKVKTEIFVGYAATLEAPVGLTFGVVGRTVGAYVRFRTNLSSQKFAKTFEGEGDNVVIADRSGGTLLEGLHNEKINTMIGTLGLVFKVTPSFYISAGGGYCKREYLREFQLISDVNSEVKESFWAKSNGETSFAGAALDLDGTFKIGKHFYGSLGCSMLNFKYLSANAGIGVFF